MPKPAEKSRRLADVFFRHLVGNMRNGVLAIARAGGIVLINDEARRLFRLPADDVSGLAYA
ncbi:MAG: PAS domain-containing protein, partial [Acidimicrobiia bacterium]